MVVPVIKSWVTDVGIADVNADTRFNFGSGEVGKSDPVVKSGASFEDSVGFSIVFTDGVKADDVENVLVIGVTTFTVTYAISYAVPLLIRKIHWPSSSMLIPLMINVPFSITKCCPSVFTALINSFPPGCIHLTSGTGLPSNSQLTTSV